MGSVDIPLMKSFGDLHEACLIVHSTSPFHPFCVAILQRSSRALGTDGPPMLYRFSFCVIFTYCRNPNLTVHRDHRVPVGLARALLVCVFMRRETHVAPRAPAGISRYLESLGWSILTQPRRLNTARVVESVDRASGVNPQALHRARPKATTIRSIVRWSKKRSHTHGNGGRGDAPAQTTQKGTGKSLLDAHARARRRFSQSECSSTPLGLARLVGGRERGRKQPRGGPRYGAVPTSHLIDHQDGRCVNAPQVDESDEGNGPGRPPPPALDCNVAGDAALRLKLATTRSRQDDASVSHPILSVAHAHDNEWLLAGDCWWWRTSQSPPAHAGHPR